MKHSRGCDCGQCRREAIGRLERRLAWERLWALIARAWRG